MRKGINLKLINKSNDLNNSSYVIFQINLAPNFNKTVIAWKVIENLGRGDYHPFVYEEQLMVSASDSYGNYTMPQVATDGQVFSMEETSSGDELVLSSTPAGSPHQIEISNALKAGAINGIWWRSGSVVLELIGIAPTQKAVASFKPIIFIGEASQVSQGQVLNAAILSQINTELNLFGIASADIVIKGGGEGPTAQPFTFTLENITPSE